MTTPAKRSAPTTSAEDLAVIQQNRLRAKQSIRQSADARRQSNNNNDNNNNSSNQIRLEPAKTSNRKGADTQQLQQQQQQQQQQSSSSSSKKLPPTRPLRKQHDPLGNYIEYDLSKLHNSKGGFLVDEDEAGSKTVEELARERDRERQRIKAAEELGISLGGDQPVCRECGSPELSDQLRRVFKFYVCVKCEKKEIYSLLTKTEAKADYLLTDAELNDPDLLPHLLKRNPHKASYSNMMLYLRFQLEAYAFGPHKWGSEENLDLEFSKREEKKKLLSEKKFKKGLNELRKRTKGNVWQKRKDLDSHKHEWLSHYVVGNDEEGEEVFTEEAWEEMRDEMGEEENVTKKMLCTTCGQELEVEEF